MTPSFARACLWIVAPSAVAVLPARRNHGPQASALIAAGIPLLGCVTCETRSVTGRLPAPRRRTGGTDGARVRDAAGQVPEDGAWTG